VHRYSWSQEPPKPFEPEVEAWVQDEVSPLLDAIGGTPLLIAKSLGTNAAGLGRRAVTAGDMAYTVADRSVGGSRT
jgi:hypothetical protein